MEDTVSGVGHEVKHQIDKNVEKGRNAYREHRQERRAEKKSQKVDEALKRYDPEYDTAAYSTQKQAYTRGQERAIKNAEKSQKTINQTFC